MIPTIAVELLVAVSLLSMAVLPPTSVHSQKGKVEHVQYSAYCASLAVTALLPARAVSVSNC